VSASFAGIVLGILVGLRHAFEPDHLTAVSTLVTEASSARRGAALGALWGLGHTVSLVVVGMILLVAGASLPERVAAGFELAVSAMLIGLGARSIVRASVPAQAHAHAHADAVPHLHVAGRIVAWRPLVVGLVHGLAGSGALTALVFAQLPTTALRLVYISLFGAGSVAGMAIASGLAGASLHAAVRRRGVARSLALATGALSIVVGCLWAVPMLKVVW
jgi:high-affinity nickel-transport protein